MTTDNKPLSEKIRIRFDDWSWCNPRCPKYADAMHTATHLQDQLTRSQILIIVSAAENYFHIVEHPAGVESIIKQLRAVRKVLRDDLQQTQN